MISSIKLYSKKTYKLSSFDKKNIFKLKKKNYNFKLKEQQKWFDTNIKKNDIHNLLFFKKKLIGYNCLRSVKYFFFRKKNILYKKKFLLFDTLIIDPKFRKKGLSTIILKKSLRLITLKRKIGVLFCKNSMINYYKKFLWLKFNKKVFFSNYVLKPKKTLMIYNPIKNDFSF